MQYLTIEQLLFIHERVIAETGGESGVLNWGALEPVVARPRQGYGGVDAFPDLFSKAAALMHGIISSHPFLDGNKRTAVAAAGLTLTINGFSLVTSNDDLLDFALSAAQNHTEVDAIAAWLQARSGPIEL